MLSRLRCLLIILTLVAFGGWIAPLSGTEIIDHPFLGVTHITRTETSPRTLHMHIVKIDLAVPGISFKLTPPGGTRETVRQSTLGFLNQEYAQVAIDSHFFLPFPSPDTDAFLVGFAASGGNIYSAFEAPVQNYAIVTYCPAVNIDPSNHASIVHNDTNFPDGKHIVENVTVWTATAGSGQIVTNGVKTIPMYIDAQHPAALLTPNATYSNNNSWYNLLNARTSIGLSQDNQTVFLFTVDRAGGSSGMSVGEVADLLINDYGVYNALNLDGGGSTTLAMENPITHVRSVVNVSSDNPSGRSEGSNLAVFASLDTLPPFTTATISPSPNGNGWNNTDVTVTLNAVDNPGGAVKQIEFSLTGAQPGGPVVVAGSTAWEQITAEGITTMTYFATDYLGNQETPETLPVRIDKTRPVISGMPDRGCTIWPPDSNKMVQVATVTAADALSGLAAGSFNVIGSSNEPFDPAAPAIVVTPNGSGGFIVQLRADRLGTGTGRIYTLTATASDLAGNTRTVTGTCAVPHDQGKNP